jgi:hypothetical protein
LGVERLMKSSSHLLFTIAVLFLTAPYLSYSQNKIDTIKHYQAKRITSPPKIDGILDDDTWQNIIPTTDFTQAEPKQNTAPTFKTEVSITYDDHAIYIGATLYDNNPDSILRELGNRDEYGLNADFFDIKLDTYHGLQDAFVFGVYASGVQIENKFSDYTFNSVWESAVKITDKGWVVEMKIPYSAFRFPKKDVQEWGMQITRNVRRYREFVQWCYTPPGEYSFQRYWGTLQGIEKIQPPVRLSFTPYLSAYYESAPEYNSDGTYKYTNEFSYNAGSDVKYGINESFTLDMILFPDFGQVQSDQKVKNLSYREVTYGENREFFKEGTELFSRNDLFYSRRIGKTPSLFYSIPYMIDSTDKIIKNPNRVSLINAMKLSGRTEHKLGIGILNAVTAETNAIIEDKDGNTRRIMTEPLTNFNVIVFDQQLKNNSSVYFFNSNVMRNGSARDANVTSAGFYLNNKKSTFELSSDWGITQVYTPIDSMPNNFSTKIGYGYRVRAGKIGGKFEYGAVYGTISKTYDPSDIGYQQFGNYGEFGTYGSYRILKPGKVFRNLFVNLNGNYSYNLETSKRTNHTYGINVFGTLLNYLTIFGGSFVSPTSNYDYYEPRVEGRYFRTWQFHWNWVGLSTDYRKKFAVDLNLNGGNFFKNNVHHIKTTWAFDTRVNFRYRFNDKFTVNYSIFYAWDPLNPGFADIDPNTGDIIFGGRMLETVSHNVGIKYIIKNDLSFGVTARHYWNNGQYVNYYTLGEFGYFLPNDTYTGSNDFSFTAFNVDAYFAWQFAPGSKLTIAYKNIIDNDLYGDIAIPQFGENFKKSFSFPQTNNLSVKVLYYLDYLKFRKRKK